MVSTKRMVTTVITGLILAASIWAVTYGQENAQKLTAISNVTVLDANSKVVGKVQSVTFDAATAFVGFTLPGVSQPIFLGVTRDRIHGAQDNVAFESMDCTGTPYLFRGLVATPPDRELSPQTAVVFPGSTLYVQDLNLSPQDVEPQSVLTRSGCLVVNIGTLTLLPAKKTFNLDEQFTAPFTTR